ncbi:MAG: hypothetical protein JWQ21_1531 [Herminiimonas sp.]|nr:hypothetical protein [Herminiimonas sp.]
MKAKPFISRVAIAALILAAGGAHAWSLPQDNATFNKAEIAEVLAANDYAETSGYKQKIEFVDFNSYGKKFTEVTVRLDPEHPRLFKGKKIVVVAGEAGSEYGMDFIETPEGKEGMGPWLAKRGVTFIALTRVGRWNFLAADGTGSWKDVPLSERMPIFNRDQKAHWSPDNYASQPIAGASSSTQSEYVRVPKPGTEFYRQMLAANPVTMLLGYQKAVEQAIPPAERKKSLLLYWGMSTGGAFLWPLAKHATPDGYLGWGTSSTGVAYFYSKAKTGNFDWPYDKSALRVRERGTKDFNFYTSNVPQETKDLWWQNALKDPRFKSAEDPAMFFNSGALAELAMRLWLSDFLPPEYRKNGFARFTQDLIDVSYPPKELKTVRVLDMYGTKDEVMPPPVVDAQREIMEPYTARYRVARVEDFHHYLFTQESIKVVGSLWLRFIESGHFDAVKTSSRK